MEFSWTYWRINHDVLIGLLLLEGLYLMAVGPASRYFSYKDSCVTKWQVTSFTLGVGFFFIADNGPLHDLSEQFLFSAHMTQHVLLTLVVPPLLLIGIPRGFIKPFLGIKGFLVSVRFLTSPIIAFGLFNVIFALWHLPRLYGATLDVHAVHIFEHLLFISTAVVMWFPILSPFPEIPRPRPIMQILYLFMLPIAQLVVFAPITFSDTVIYSFYAEAPRIWNSVPLLDQQLGGAIMKVASSIIFLILLAVVFFKWFSESESLINDEPDDDNIASTDAV